jgi:tungstate transport system ATP-binding protein
MDPLLTLTDIVLRRDDFTLQIDRLALQSRRIYLLYGANGAGKSTLLHMLALLLPPAAGELCYDGVPVKTPLQRQQLRRQITLVEQNPFLFDTSVYQNLAFGLRLRDVRGDLQRRRIDQALQAVGLEGFADRQATELSGGETRRVALARAMVLRPQLLLLDEPTAGLDQQVLPVFERCLAALPGQGSTVVIAGHDADQPRRLGGTVLRLERGRLAPAASAPLSLCKENA